MMDKVKTANPIGFSVFQVALTKVHELYVRYSDRVTSAQFAQCFRVALYALDGHQIFLRLHHTFLEPHRTT